jgi:hypothetical protein
VKDDPVDEALLTLREALAVEPSADFEARVRARLASRRPPGRRVSTWLLAAAAVALLALALVGRPPRATAPAPLARSTPPPAIAPTATGAADTRAARTASSRPRRTEPARSFVPPGGMARVVRYVAAVRAHPLGPEVLTPDPGAPLAEPDALVIPAIQITPLEISEGSFE